MSPFSITRGRVGEVERRQLFFLYKLEHSLRGATKRRVRVGNAT